uniref:nucleoside-diphosphate kinase n=1 Tax=Suricata suricatta TaxID=37032 RepID=A0A673SUI0_SURSU
REMNFSTFNFLTMANEEHTVTAIKPRGVQHTLVGEIIKHFDCLLQASEELRKQHHIVMQTHPLFPRLAKYLSSGALVAMVWEGLAVVKTGRGMLWETNPADLKPGTTHGGLCIQDGRNITHASDSGNSAEKEISLWFKPEELVDDKPCAFDRNYE